MIEYVYAELKKLGAVKTSDEFSRNWLGMEKSYLRTMKAKRRRPSARVLANVAAKLKGSGRELEKNKDPKLALAGHCMVRMGDRCIEEMLRG